MLLHVVGRQPVVCRADVALEESPRAPRQAAEVLQLGRGQHDCRAFPRLADPPHQQRRQRPEQQDRCGYHQRRGLPRRQRERGRQCEDRCEPHRDKRAGQAMTQRALDLARRVPLQQPATGQQPPARTCNRIEAEPGFEWQAREGQWRTREAPHGRQRGLAQMRAHRHVGRTCDQVLDRREQGRHEQRGQHPSGADQRGQRIRRMAPYEQQQERRRRSHETAAEVVRQLPARQE